MKVLPNQVSARPLDIVFLTTSLCRAGAETQMVRIATALQRRGWKVGVITMLPSTAFLEELKGAGIPLLECPGLPSRVPLRMVYHMIRQLRRWRPALMVTFNFPADVAGRLCGTLAGVPVLVSGFGTSRVKTRLRELFYRFTEPFIAVTVSNSMAGLAYLGGRHILTPAKTMMIRNGLSLEGYPAPMTREQARARLALQGEPFLWVAIGNMRVAKDYPNLLNAAVLCKALHPGFQLKIAGGGAELAGLTAMAQTLGLAGIVEFLGPRQDVAEILRAADAYVLASAWEGTPNALMEAMASGLPVVTTDVGDARALVEKAGAGFVVPPGRASLLAVQMVALMGLDLATRQTMGAKGRDLIRDEFENEQAVDAWEALFRRLAPGNRTE